MNYKPLGRTGLNVSAIGLGTMTWGEQNTEAQAHEQLSLAVDAGVNLIDTAEIYPVPPKPETAGRTEAYIGSWLKAQPSRRGKVVLATKAAGPARQAARPTHIRGGATSFTRANLEQAVNDSLRRLNTDVIDLYQLHWPDRSTNSFGQRGVTQLVQEDTVPIGETLQALDAIVRSGKVRHVGVSNETPWGLAQFLAASAQHDWVRVASIQNPYSLLNRSFEVGLSEFALREQVGLLAYSPLAFGALSGKYLAGLRPAGARLTLYERFARYNGEHVERVIAGYVRLFRAHGIDPAQGALAFVNQRPFVASTLIGATTTDQLRSNLASAELVLSAELLAAIDALHARHPDPAP